MRVGRRSGRGVQRGLLRGGTLALLAVWSMVGVVSVSAQEEAAISIPITGQITGVQPLTGIVLWTTNSAVATAPIQLEYCYFSYDQIVQRAGEYDWAPLERVLDQVAGRGHQLVLRWHDTYVGRPAGVPAYLQQAADYRGLTAPSENKPTGFPDWSHAGYQQFVLDFFTRFAEKYDTDPRLAFVQVGFGLWAEYHIYDGPLQLGKTFPALEFQARFVKHLATRLEQTPWMISVDAAGSHTPFASQPELRKLTFGLFDDSVNHKRHEQENVPNWKLFGLDRWQVSPMGGEFAFFSSKDQKQALAERGPYGTPFADQARRFHLTFVIGDAQPRFQPAARIQEAGQACGYRFCLKSLQRQGTRVTGTIENRGVAPCYYDVFPTFNGQATTTSLKGLLPGDSRSFTFADHAADSPVFTLESSRLVPGQRIEFETP